MTGIKISTDKVKQLFGYEFCGVTDYAQVPMDQEMSELLSTIKSPERMKAIQDSLEEFDKAGNGNGVLDSGEEWSRFRDGIRQSAHTAPKVGWLDNAKRRVHKVDSWKPVEEMKGALKAQVFALKIMKGEDV